VRLKERIQMEVGQIDGSRRKRQLADQLVPVRLTTKQLERIAAAAKARGMKLEDWIIETLVVSTRPTTAD
jgi:hypothetical protein